ncbi:MAG: TlpA family protein disulfide reductase [Acidobacteria bacterium]|nr:TlpA family protein disulfide reductase [Acidobacteriota bacterium]MCK6685222.1 TlpA family protein disulfide reductase [Thermoanaerobaculia bacterium]
MSSPDLPIRKGPGRGRWATALALAGVLAAGTLLPPARQASAEPVKLLTPDHYQARIVAPRKGRVVLANFWATWCLPCREEMPDLIAAARKFRSRDLAVILISVDTKRTASSDVPKFLKDLKVPFVSYLAKTHDPQLFIDAVDKKWDGSLPYTLLYDRNGVLALRLEGKHSEKSLTDSIQKVLNLSPRK